MVYMYWFDTQKHKLPHIHVRYQGAEAVFTLDGQLLEGSIGRRAEKLVAVTTPEYGRVVIEASDGKRYFADLSALNQVYCFPKGMKDWQSVAVDSYGLSLIWTSRFEVHVDQILGLAERSEVSARAS